jgi:uncharacterized membrane protein
MGRLRAVWSRLIEGLWFVPVVLVLGAILLAVAMVELSASINSDVLAHWPRVFGVSPEGARSMLAAIAGSMITVAGVTFSITMVAVTQASSQYTPRILRNFMRDRANQVVLGVFVGVFAYCLVVLRTIRGSEDLTFVPSLAVLVGVLLALVGIAVLIFFVHHIATTLQASEIVARITEETLTAVDRLFPDPLDGEEALPRDEPGPLALMEAGWEAVPAPRTGHLQQVDVSGLARLVREHGRRIRIQPRVGGFIAQGLPLAWVAPGEGAGDEGGREDGGGEDGCRELGHKIAARCTIGTYRTIDQDAAFGIRQLVDIALKALSPGINDTTTAVTCIDHLGVILGCAADRRLEGPSPPGRGAEGLEIDAPTFAELLGGAFDQIRRSADANVTVLQRQLTTLAMLAGRTRSPRRRGALREQIRRVEEASERTVPAAHDRAELRDLAARAAAELAGGS